MTIEESHIIDWYDGIVQAIARFDSRSSWYYCSLLAWDMEADLKVFGLVKLSASWLARFLDMLNSAPNSDRNQKWSVLMRTVQQFIDECQEEMLAIVCKDLGENILLQKRLNVEHFKADVGLSIESLLEPTRVNQWLSLLGQ